MESVDLPQPEDPTKATRLPCFRERLKSFINGSPRREYPKVRFLISTFPESFAKLPASPSMANSVSSCTGYFMTSSRRSICVRISCKLCPAVIRLIAGMLNCSKMV